MHKRSCCEYEKVFSGVELDSSFPIILTTFSPNRDEISYTHAHGCLEIGYCHSGSGIFLVENRIFNYRAGDVVYIGSGQTHIAQSAVESGSDWSFIYLDPVRLISSSFASDDAYSAVFPSVDFKNLIESKEFPKVCNIVESLVGELKDCQSGYRDAVRGLVWQILALVRRIMPEGDKVGVSAHGNSSLERVAPALRYIMEHHAESLTVEQISKVCNMSESHFRRVFRSATGVSPHKYLNNIRLHIASVKIRSTSLPILQIAMESGFDNISTFNRRFRDLFDTNPLKMRKK